MKYKFFTFLVLVVMTLLFSNAPNVNAEGCTAYGRTWSPSNPTWKNIATQGSQTFNFSQTYTTNQNPVVEETFTDTCTTASTNGSKCNVSCISLISYPDVCPELSQRMTTCQSPANKVDLDYPVCGNSWSGNGSPFTLTGSTDATSGINVSGGSCTATPGSSCNVIISDIAGNTKSCVSPVREEQFYTVTASATNGTVDTPPVNPQQVASGGKATFHFNSSSTTTPVRDGTCPAGASPSYDPVYGYWSYTTGKIIENCTVTMTFPANLQVTPSASSGGSISPNTLQYANPGETKIFSIVPNSGYTATMGGTCGGSPSSGTSAFNYTTNPLSSNCTVTVSFTSTPIPPTMTGTISASDCEISVGKNSCNSTITWTTTHPVGSSSVTTPTSITVGTGPNGTAGYPVVYGSRTFYLYNNGVNLASDGAMATCEPGTTWNGSICEEGGLSVPDLISYAPSPNIATVNTPRTFSANIRNIGGESTTLGFRNIFQIASGANGSGTVSTLSYVSTSALGSLQNRTITSPSYTFTGTGTSSVRLCADKQSPSDSGAISEADENNNCSAWTNVTVSNSVGTVTGYHDAYSGTVPASQCRADGWAVYSNDKALDLNIRILSDGVQVATGVASTYRGDLETAGVCTGGTCSFWINLAGLISTGVNHTITAQAQNPGDNSWVTLPASPKTLNCAAGTIGTLTATNCDIKKDESSCNSALTWTVTNPVGTSNITSNTPSANTVITTGNSGTNFSVSVPYSSRTFFLNNNSVPLASVTPTATCVSGTVWDGAKCMEPTSPPSDPVCGDSVVESPETCDDGINSGSCSTSSCTKSCTVNTMCGGGGTSLNGKCPIPAKHYSCLIGASVNNVNGISSWTWDCSGINGGAPASCTEMKKKPGYKEE